jgi:hypothetical protein
MVEQVWGGITRNIGSVRVESTPSDIALGTAGPAIIALRNTHPGGASIQATLPTLKAGGQLVLKCARSSSGPVQVEDLATLWPGDAALFACDGGAWYEIWTQHVGRSGTETFDLSTKTGKLLAEVQAPWIGDEPVHLTLEAEDTAGLTVTMSPTVVARTPGAGFSIEFRVKRTSNAPVTYKVHWSTL